VKRSEIGGKEDFEELYFGGNESFIGKILGLGFGGTKIWRERSFILGGSLRETLRFHFEVMKTVCGYK